MKLPYNPSDKNSVIEYAKKLKGKSLRQACDQKISEHYYSGKGNFGHLSILHCCNPINTA
jgi:DNA mismatch repair protein MutH